MNIRFCSAALVYDHFGQILLVSNRERTKFLFPKGGIEPGLSPSKNAQKECLEETGYTCDSEGFSLGVYEIYKRGIINRVDVIALHSRGEIIQVQHENRVVTWVSCEKALEMISPYLAPFILRIQNHIEMCALHDSRK